MFLFLINLAIAHEPGIYAFWEKPPKVNICDDDVNQEMVLKAIEHWKNLGHNIEGVYLRKNCAYETGSIYIRFLQEEVTEAEYANTLSKWNPGSHLYKRAIINLGEEALNMQDVYTHELGHAFGYIHTQEENHVMYGPKGPFDNLVYKK